MYLFPLVFLVTVGLLIWFVFVSGAAVPLKIIIAALFAASLFVHPAAFPVAGLFLRIAVALFVLFYQMYQTAKSQ